MRENEYFHTAEVLWLVSMLRSPVIGILVMCKDTTIDPSPLFAWPWFAQKVSIV